MPKLVEQQASEVAVTILNGQSLSAAVDLTGLYVVRIVMPAAWDAAALTFAGAPTAAGTYTNLYDTLAGEYTIQVAASRRIMVPPADLLGDCFLKMRSGPAAGAVAQNADRALTLLVRPL